MSQITPEIVAHHGFSAEEYDRIRTADRPAIDPADRAEIRAVDDNFTIIVLHYGFMEAPNCPRDLGLESVSHKKALNPAKTSYFIGRNTLKASADQGTPLWQDRIFMFLQRNASDPTDFLKIPPGKVLELGEQVTV